MSSPSQVESKPFMLFMSFMVKHVEIDLIIKINHEEHEGHEERV